MHHHMKQLTPNNCSLKEQLPGADPGIFLIGVVQYMVGKPFAANYFIPHTTVPQLSPHL